uniref:ubiquitinyl hydrolase 1 n=1 Tax=Capra hircus TaxID=9925 RepID=A0A452EIB0_CAPHI
EGSLCAQLCLNNLLQEEYFRPGELSSVAHQLGENGRRSASEDYHTFLQQPSGNMDHRAFYSIQVINNALKVQSLELILFSTPDLVCCNSWGLKESDMTE